MIRSARARARAWLRDALQRKPDPPVEIDDTNMCRILKDIRASCGDGYVLMRTHERWLVARFAAGSVESIEA